MAVWDPRRLSITTARIEALVMVGLGIHGYAALRIIYPAVQRPWHVAVVAGIAGIGAVGLAFAERGPLTYALRALITLSAAWALMFNTGGVNSFFLLWCFVVVATYPLVLPAPIAAALAPVVGVFYASHLIWSAGALPLFVVIARALLLLLIGWIVWGLGAALKGNTRTLERSIEQLELTNQTLRNLIARERFVIDAVHELGTPLSSISLYNRLMTTNPEKTPTYQVSMSREIDRINYLVHELSTLASMPAHVKTTLSFSSVDVTRMVSELIEDRRTLAIHHGLTLNLDAHIDYTVNGDFRLLEQAINILLMNACQYTPSGGRIEVGVSASERRGREGVAVAISDTGPGIPRLEQDAVFERFQRGAVGLAARQRGFGIGLSIARDIVERHSGDLSLQSPGALGDGATFTIWLPAAV